MALTGPSCARHAGRESAEGHAGGHADEDPGGERQALQRSPHFSFWRSTSKNIMRGGRIRCSAYCGAAADHGIVFLERLADLAVDGQVDGRVLAAAADFHLAGFGDQHGPVGQHVRADGREADGGHRGKDDGAAGGERISRGAGGRGDDQAVGFVGAHELVVDVDVQIDHAGDGGFGEHHIVERLVARDDRAVAAHLGVQQLAAADAVLAAQGALQFGKQLVDGDGGQESEAAQIDGEQRDLAAADGARGGEQRAVAAQHDHQVAAFGHVVARQTVGARRRRRRSLRRSARGCRALRARRAAWARHRRGRTAGLEMMPTVWRMAIADGRLNDGHRAGTPCSLPRPEWGFP